MVHFVFIGNNKKMGGGDIYAAVLISCLVLYLASPEDDSPAPTRQFLSAVVNLFFFPPVLL